MEKIDLMTDYPCPCRREARLIPIALTEALGCDRCPNVYVITAEGDQVEQVSGLPNTRRRWRWTGKTWENIQAKHSWKRSTILVSAILLFIVLAWILVHVVHGYWAVLACILLASIGPFLVERLSRWFLHR